MAKQYTLSFADAIKHQPSHPERTAKRNAGWDVVFREWPSREAMLKTIQMQGKRAPRETDWRAVE